ncbi:MAG: alpha-glucosidase [Promethearchaeota archaeon]|nr:MAG: alpha-glucosidase [Candidatus Lokiarchaeota archaeon]
MVEKRIVLIGAGSTQFGLGSMGDILTSEILKGSTIVLHDIRQEALKPIGKVGASIIKGENLDYKLESTISREKALEGADFIISSIEVGDRFTLWEQDYEIPRKYGNRQTFGENGGPGGLFHSLRIIRPILDICTDIMQLCPQALFINFSNPMSRICLAISRKFPKLHFFGLCHEFFFLERHLPKILATPFFNLTNIKAGGLNHFGVLLEIAYKDSGKDAYPEIREKAVQYFSENTREVDLVKYILQKYHVLSYTTDSHFSEYIHWAWEQANEKDIRDFYTGYKAMCKSELGKMKRFLAGKISSYKKWYQSSGERVIPIIEGIVSNSGHYEYSVNLVNNDIIEGLPRDLVVECPCIVDKKGLHGVPLKNIPKGILGLWRNQANVQDLVVEAVLSKSKEMALHALLADPVVDSPTAAEKMLDEILNLQKEYLGYLQ